MRRITDTGAEIETDETGTFCDPWCQYYMDKFGACELYVDRLYVEGSRAHRCDECKAAEREVARND